MASYFVLRVAVARSGGVTAAARLTGAHHSTISRWFTRASVPRAEQVRALCAVSGVPIEAYRRTALLEALWHARAGQQARARALWRLYGSF